MSQPPIPKSKNQTRITINTSKKNTIFPPFKSLKAILKEKLLYNYVCSIHHSNYIKYCNSCKKDICTQCETESHIDHQFINYDNILPDLNEINIIQKALKNYEKLFNDFLNVINCWKKEFDEMVCEYKKQMNSIMDYVNKFSNEKINFNNIYKYRSICALILDYNNGELSDRNKDEKNSKIIELMENILLEKDKNKENNEEYFINKIKKEYNFLLSYNNLLKLIKSFDRDTLLTKMEKIINIIDYKKRNIHDNIRQYNNRRNSEPKYSYDNTPNLNFYKDRNISSHGKSNTAASTLNKYYNITSSKESNKIINQNVKESSVFKLNPYNSYKINSSREERKNQNKSTNNINYQYNNRLCIYEKKKVREKSNDHTMPSLDNYENINNNIIENYNNKTNKIKIHKDFIQESINNTQINPSSFLFDKYINNNCIHKVIRRRTRRNDISENRTQNIVNKALLCDYKGFDVNDKDSGPELLNNSSHTIQGVKYCYNTQRSTSLEYRPYKYKYLSHLGKIINSNYNSNSFDKKTRTINLDRNNSYGTKNDMTSNENSHRTFNNNNLISYINSKNNNYYSRNCESKNNNINMSVNSNSLNNSLINFIRHKSNNSVININKKNINVNVNNSFAYNKNNANVNSNSNANKIRRDMVKKDIHNKIYYNQIYNNQKKQKKIYVHKKYNPLDDGKNLSSIDSINSSMISSIGQNTNKKEKNDSLNKDCADNDIKKDDYIYVNGNRPLVIGLELGNTECKLGVLNKENNFELFNINNHNNNNYSIPTIISFEQNNPDDNDGIKIGYEAEQIRVTNASQTIFNIIKLIGKKETEIIGRKDLWPFNLYSEEKTNKPYVRIKEKNKNKENKSKYICYNFEDILTIFLQKLFEKFFNKIVTENKKEEKNNDKKENVNIIKLLDINLVVSVPNYYNYTQRKIIENIITSKLFPKIEIHKKDKTLIKSNIYGKYNIQLNNIKIESVSNLTSFCLINKDITSKNIVKLQKKSINYLVLYIEGGSVNISIINLNNNNTIEIKAINGAEFGEEDFVDNFICSCLSDFKEKIRKNCLTSPVALAKLRKSLNIVKKCFNKEDIIQTEVNIDKLYDSIDLKMALNKNDYIKSCMGLFRKIIYLIKDTIVNSNIDIKDINDILLIGNITDNTKLRSMLSELFKDNNKNIYNKLINKNNESKDDINSYIIKGAVMLCLHSNLTIPKLRFISISPISFGIESLNGIMDMVIEKGNNIPIKFNKYIKIRKPGKNENNMIKINIYEGENKYVKNNKLISNNFIDINNFKYEKRDENGIEILFQFYIDSNYNLNVFILDKITFRRKFECLINFDCNDKKF